jgi:hypothetical protein
MSGAAPPKSSLELTSKIVEQGFARRESLELVLVDDDGERLLARLAAGVRAE